MAPTCGPGSERGRGRQGRGPSRRWEKEEDEEEEDGGARPFSARPFFPPLSGRRHFARLRGRAACGKWLRPAQGSFGASSAGSVPES